MRGLEPPHREAPDPKSGVSTNFTTSATISVLKKTKKKIQLIGTTKILIKMARLTRFERVTDALEGHCSIQLSYRRLK